MASAPPLRPHLLEKLMEQWNNPEGRVKLFVIANLIALGLLALGVVLMVLVLLGRFPGP